MTSTTLTIDQLRLSPYNVRTSKPHPDKDREMEASLLAEGQHLPIICHPMLGQKRADTWGALGGGRRYRAFKALIENGDLPRDWPIKVTCKEASPAELIEISITENLIRLDLKDHELFAAIARAAANGHDVDQIATNLGRKDPALVGRWLRLGRLAKPVFAAFAAGNLDLQQATAYAATEDQALQEATFARLSAGHAYAHTPAAIRVAMKVGDREAAKLLRFVGDEAYRAAGGRFELDLFAEAEEDRGRVVDEGKLQQLVEARYTTIRDEVRVTTARRDLRFVPTPPQTDYNSNDFQLHVEPKRSAPSGAGCLTLPAGEVVAHIGIDDAGEPTISYWWASRKAKAGGAKPTTDAPVSARAIPHHVAPGSAIDDRASPASRAADAAIKEDTGLSQDAIQILRALRRAILRAALVRDADRSGDSGRGGDASVDYLVWSQLRLIAGQEQPKRIGINRLHTETIGAFDLAQRARAQIEASGVPNVVNAALGELTRQSFYVDPDLGSALLDYRASPQRLKNLAAAVVAGFALERSLAAPGYDIPVHDVLAREIGADDGVAVREYWNPTAEILGLHPRVQRLKLAEDLVDAATLKRWSTLRNDHLTQPVLDAVLARPDWVHPLLRFAAPPDDPAIANDLELREAAE